MMYQLWVSHSGLLQNCWSFKTLSRAARKMPKKMHRISVTTHFLFEESLGQTLHHRLRIAAHQLLGCFIFWEVLCWGLREPATLQDIFTVAGWWLQPMD